jgi:outer membrane biosynthesis protein TonB
MRETSNTIALLSISILLHTLMLVISLLASPRLHPVQETANRTQGRNQQSLPPEKRKSLATIGPEDVLPANTDERDVQNSQRRNRRARPRAGSAARTIVNPAAIIAPAPTQPPQAINATVDPSPSPSPSATPAVAVAKLSQEYPSQQPNTLITLQNLLILTLLVSCALIFVLFKLMSKLREGSG